MLKQSECSKLAKAKFKQAAQGRAEPQGGNLTKRSLDKQPPLRPLLSFEILFYSLLLMLLLLLILLLLLMLLIAGAADV